MAWKTAEARLTETLDFMSEVDNGTYKNGATLVDRRLERMSKADQKAISDAMSLGDSVAALLKDKDEEKDRRHAIRAVLLLKFAVKKEPVKLSKDLIAKFGSKAMADLKNEIKSGLPVTDNSPLRDFWDPKHFTDPKAYKADKPFKFIVWGMMNTHTGRGTPYFKILENPDIAKTFLISSSIIDQVHKSTYYPYGFILKVPKENIISTNSKDQAFKNYKAMTEGMTAAEATDMLPEVRRVSASYEIAKPDDILKGTSGKGGAYGYNEIAVMGTSPEGKSVDVVGLFVKVKDDNNTPYVRKGMKTPWVTEEVQEHIDKLVEKKKIPICNIIDPIDE
jgi:hypothetical protein